MHGYAQKLFVAYSIEVDYNIILIFKNYNSNYKFIKVNKKIIKVKVKKL